MAAVDVLDVNILDNPAPFVDPLKFEITYDVREPLKDDIEWRVVYVGSAEDEAYDQELDCVLCPAMHTGQFKFILEVDAPEIAKIPPHDLLGVTIILLTCSYNDQEFIRIGYYVNNEYIDPVLIENPPPAPIVEKVIRNLASQEPRVTRFPHKFDFTESAMDNDMQDISASTQPVDITANEVEAMIKRDRNQMLMGHASVEYSPVSRMDL